MSNIIDALEKEQLRTDLPRLQIGDTVRVFVKVIEGSRERLQAFEGIVIKIQNGGIRTTFTVRRLSYGIGVERTFPLHSPRIGKIEVVRHGVVRRAKLYYLRDRIGKSAKIKERIVKRSESAAGEGAGASYAGSPATEEIVEKPAQEIVAESAIEMVAEAETENIAPEQVVEETAAAGEPQTVSDAEEKTETE